MLRMFADMLSGIELEQLQTHLCKFRRPSVQLQLCIKFTIMEQKDKTSQGHLSLVDSTEGLRSHMQAADCLQKR